MNDDLDDDLTAKCRQHGCEREAVVRWKGIPLCAPHYEQRIEKPVHAEPVRTRVGELEHGLNRHP